MPPRDRSALSLIGIAGLSATPLAIQKTPYKPDSDIAQEPMFVAIVATWPGLLVWGHQVRAQALMRRKRYVDIVILGIVAALSIWVLHGLPLFTR